MFTYIRNLVTGAVRSVFRGFRKVTGIGPDNIPDALSVFTVFTRICVICLGSLALIATIIPALSADPVAARLLGASSSLWQAGSQAGYESRYGFERAERRAFGGQRSLGGGPRVDVYDLDDDDRPSWAR